MANEQIKDLPATTTVNGSSEFAVENSNITYKVSGTNLAAGLKSAGGLLGASDLKANLTTETAGSPLDATQGKALADLISGRISGTNIGTYSSISDAAAAIFDAMPDSPSVKVGLFTRNGIGGYIYLAYKNSVNYATMLCWSYSSSRLTQINKQNGTIQNPIEYLPTT